MMPKGRVGKGNNNRHWELKETRGMGNDIDRA